MATIMVQQSRSADVDQSIDDFMLPLPVCDQPIEEAYAIESVIGEGSYSTVHSAKSRCSGESVVVKAVRVDTLDSDERRGALQEAQTLSHLRHTNIIRYHDVRYSEEQAALYIIMEHAAGGDLRGLIQRRASQKRTFSEDFILLTFVQITLALSHVHERGFLHRDIKSSNVFVLGHDNIVKLGDFGLATMVQPAKHRLANTAVGTPCYRSPEMCENKPYSSKSDIWSLGCLLYELTTLKRAFNGSTMPALVMNILMGRFSPVPTRFSVHLRSLIRSMLAQNPARRPTADAILKLPWMQPYLEQYSKLMQMHLPETCLPRASNGSAYSADAMSLAMPPTIPPAPLPTAGKSSACLEPGPQIDRPAPDTRTRAACKEVRRLLGNVQASLSARLKETPAATGASLRSSLTKGKAAVAAGARMRASASQRIRSFCLSDVEDAQIAPVLKPMHYASVFETKAPSPSGPSAPSFTVDAEVGTSGFSANEKSVYQGAAPALQKLSSLSSLSSICSQPTRDKEDEAPWGSIVPVHGVTLWSPEAKPTDQISPSKSLPAEHARPRTPLLPSHSMGSGTRSGAARLEVDSDALAEQSGSYGSGDHDTARARLRSAHEMARDTHKDQRHASGHRLVSKAWLEDNLAALDQMQGALTASTELRQSLALERCCSRSCTSSRTSPVPTNGTDRSSTTWTGDRAMACSLTPSPQLNAVKPSLTSAAHESSSPGQHPPPGSCFTLQTSTLEAAPVPAAFAQGRKSLGTGKSSAASPGSSVGADSVAARGKHAPQGNPDAMPASPGPPALTVNDASPSHQLGNRTSPVMHREGPARTAISATQHIGGRRSVHAVSSSVSCRTSMQRRLKEAGSWKARPQWSVTQRPSNQKCARVPVPEQTSKAQERAAERRRVAELQAAHRIALKHVKARVRRGDFKNAGASLGSQMSQDSLRSGSRPEAPAFVIPAVSGDLKMGANLCLGGALKHRANEQGSVQQRVQVQRQAPLQGAGAIQCHSHGPVGQAAGAGSGSAVGASRGGLKQRRADSTVRKVGLGAAGVTDREAPVVEIFVPRCSLPSQARAASGVRASSSKTTVHAVSLKQGVVQEVNAAKRCAEEVAHVDQLKAKVAAETAGNWDDTGRDGCERSAATVTSEVGVKCQDEQLTVAAAGCFARSKRGPDQGQKVTGCMKGSSDVRSAGKGAGSAPGKLASGPRKSSSGSTATAARVEELRVRLEAQLGPEKLLAACQCLDSDTMTTSADGLPRQLEAVLAPQTHFAYAVYRLKMMEDIVFR